ncbi:MAG TPA: glucose-6-phosphate dehydrogenase, partial [Blastocatellia bacterium]|nr:glucose-6-phosphate dehydrogenase [Blastocatellia bacterium]
MSSRIDNPLREGVRLERTADPCTVIIFGASGDLTKRKLVPALYRLTQERLLPAEFAIVGFARSPMSHDDFRAKMKDAIVTYSEAKRVDEAVWDSFAKGIFYVSSDVNNQEAYQRISTLLDQIDQERGTAGNRVFYLSTSPSLYAEAIQQLGAARLAKPEGKGWTRIII